jgi:hypothetical protein
MIFFSYVRDIGDALSLLPQGRCQQFIVAEAQTMAASREEEIVAEKLINEGTCNVCAMSLTSRIQNMEKELV